MNQLTNPKTHAIITYTGVHYLITENQEKSLREKGIDEEIDLDGNIVKIKNIADVLTINKYYETYPDKKPPITSEFTDLQALGYAGLIKTTRKNALQQMRIGIKRYLSKNPESENPKEILNQMETRLRTLSNL